MGRKHCGKRRNCSLRAISPFPTVFSKDLYCRHIKNQRLSGKGLTVENDNFHFFYVLKKLICNCLFVVFNTNSIKSAQYSVCGILQSGLAWLHMQSFKCGLFSTKTKDKLMVFRQNLYK